MTNWKEMNLKLKLVLGFSIASLVGLGALGGLSLYFAARVVQDGVTENLQSRIDGVEATIRLSYEDNVQRKQLELDHWAPEVVPKIQFRPTMQSLEVINQATSEKVTVQMATLLYDGKPLENNQMVDQLSSVTTDAVTLFTNTSRGLVRVSTSLVKKDGNRATGTMIPTDSPVYQTLSQGKRYIGRAKVLDKWYIAAYEPILRNGELLGAFFMGTPDLSYLRIRETLKAQKILASGYFFILDGKGEFVLHPSREGQASLEMTDADGRFIFKEILAQKHGKIEYSWKSAADEPAKNKMAIFNYIPEFDWYISASVNEDEVQAALNTLKLTILITTFFAVFGMMGVSYFFGRHISSRLQDTSEKLQRITEQATQSAGELSRSSGELSNASTQSAASLEETVASLEEITSQVQNNSKVSAETSSIGSTTLETARLSKSQMNELITSMQQIQADSKRIQEMSELIDDIAFQTNLLALNAAVEAARAGDHGRGFAVVAEAVRSLALKTADSAKQISNLIEESGERVNRGVGAVQKADRSFQEIVSNIEKLSDLITQITVASGEQSVGLTQINQAMNQMDQTIQMNASSAEDLSTGSAQLSTQSEQLSEAVVELSQLVNGRGKTAA